MWRHGCSRCGSHLVTSNSWIFNGNMAIQTMENYESIENKKKGRPIGLGNDPGQLQVPSETFDLTIAKEVM